MITAEGARNLLNNPTADLTPLERGLLLDILELMQEIARLTDSLARAHKGD